MDLAVRVAALLLPLSVAGAVPVVKLHNAKIANGVIGSVANVNPPVFYAASTNFVGSGLTIYTTNVSAGAGNFPFHLYHVEWFDATANTISTVTNDLGVAGTIICTNFWIASSTQGKDLYYYWSNSSMQWANATFTGTGLGTCRAELIQLTNVATSNPVDGFVTNFFPNVATLQENGTVASTGKSLVVALSTANFIGSHNPTPSFSAGVALVSALQATDDSGTVTGWTNGTDSVTVGVTWTVASGSDDFSHTLISVHGK